MDLKARVLPNLVLTGRLFPRSGVFRPLKPDAVLAREPGLVDYRPPQNHRQDIGEHRDAC